MRTLPKLKFWNRPSGSTLSSRAGFTLSEILIALAVLGTMSGGAYTGFNAINTYAVSTPLYSESQAICQNQIDLILSKRPFDPRTNRIPAILQIGTATTPNVFVYRDPVTGNVVVTGTMTTNRLTRDIQSC